MHRSLLVVLVLGVGAGSGFALATALSAAGEDPKATNVGPSDNAAINARTARVDAAVAEDPRVDLHGRSQSTTPRTDATVRNQAARWVMRSAL